MEYVGTRWYKCDFHLHTMISDCFRDKTVTAIEWLQEVKKKGLSCIAVTDHNDYRMIDEIKELSKSEDITVFPGVEVTCDTSKIHMLILFDKEKNSDKVRDFLSYIGIDSEGVGLSDGTSLNVFEICEKAKQKGAIVIAAHIDEYNGLSSMSSANIKKLLDRKYIDAVQVVNEEIWQSYAKSKSKDEMLEILCSKYGKEVSFEEADLWRKTFNKVKEANIPMLNFSDNPCGEHESKHGLWGIGREFTWMKMDKNPNLESIRQALLSDDMRLARGKSFVNCPEQIPDFWIHSIKITDTNINPNKELYVQFNPQLNAIIGGRGSGKSTIIRLLAGAMKSADMDSLPSIAEEQNNFYKKYDSKSKLGIFTTKSEIEIRLQRNKLDYRVFVKNIVGMNNQEIHLYQVLDDGSEKEIENLNFLDFFRMQVYTQKQIFELAKDSDALMKIIDNDIEKMPDAVLERDAAYGRLWTQLSKIRNIEKVIDKEGKAQADLQDLESQIEMYKKSGISSVVEEKQRISEDEKNVKEYADAIGNVIKTIEDAVTEKMPMLADCNIQDPEQKKAVQVIVQKVISHLKTISDATAELKKLQSEINNQLIGKYWTDKVENVQQTYEKICKSLEEQNLESSKLDLLLEKQAEKKAELETILASKIELQQALSEKTKLERELNTSINNITKLRTDFIKSIIGQDENIRIDIKHMMSKSSLEMILRNMIHKDSSVGVNADIDALLLVAFGKDGLTKYRQILSELHKGTDLKEYSSVFRKSIRELSEDSFDRLITFVPEDEVEVKYKPEGARSFLPLSSASAGQKTTAMLTFILAYGDVPLLLDQPEDDLDNRLVYDLVVRRLKSSKASRQLLIVTHNANIPVNGDAEYVTSMNSDTRYVEVKAEGTLDSEKVRKEICDVMEGTEQAFEMRAKKYHLKIVE